MKIQSNYTVSRNYNQTTFEGNPFKILVKKPKINEKKDLLYRISGMIDIPSSEFAKRTEGLNERSLSFLHSLANRYNARNHYFSQKENPEFVFNILNMIKKPKSIHFDFINTVRGSFEHMENILKRVRDKKGLKFVIDLQKNVFKEKKPADQIILDLLTSLNRDEYIKHTDRYSDYLLKNYKNENAVKELDKMLDYGIYNSGSYGKTLNIDSLYNKIPALQSFSRMDISEYYSKEGAFFLDKIFEKFTALKLVNQSEKAMPDVFEMYKSTTPKNLNLRLNLINKFKFSGANKDLKYNEQEVKALRGLFEKIDEDKNLAGFVKKLITENIYTESVQDFNQILEAVPPKKGKIFIKNLLNILGEVQNPQKRKDILETELTNPFYETSRNRERRLHAERYGFGEKESFISKAKRYIENKFQELRYTFVGRDEPVTIYEPLNTQTVEKIEEPIAQKIELPVIKKIQEPQVEIAPVIKKTEEPVVEKIETPTVEKVNSSEILPETPILEHIIKTEDEPVIKLVNSAKEARQAKKLKILNDVKEVINKRLGAKTVEKQEEIYSKNATQMRLKLLNEIFDSIKDTRKTDKAVGKLKSQSSNKDAVELYKRISGRNRKLVRYMLLKRNVDGTRMFEVKDIIKFIDKADAKIAKMKESNPEFKSKDAKAYYDHLFETKIQEYGKIKRTKKK